VLTGTPLGWAQCVDKYPSVGFSPLTSSHSARLSVLTNTPLVGLNVLTSITFGWAQCVDKYPFGWAQCVDKYPFGWVQCVNELY